MVARATTGFYFGSLSAKFVTFGEVDNSMAYSDKVTTLQRVVAWYENGNIKFEGVLIDEHQLIGRLIETGLPIINIELENTDDELDLLFNDYSWVIIDKPKTIEPRIKFTPKNESNGK